MTEDGISYLVRVGDKFEDTENMENLVLFDLGLEGLEPVRLSDVADVAVTNNASEVYAKINGKPGIVLTMQKQTGYSTGEVSDRIKEKFDGYLDFICIFERYQTDGYRSMPHTDQCFGSSGADVFQRYHAEYYFPVRSCPGCWYAGG